MRVFTIVGVVLTVIGLGLLVVACSPQATGMDGMIGGMAAGIAAVTLLPMGIVFTLIGVWTQRLLGGRQRLIEEGIPGQATILSVGGGNMVVNRINVLLTFRLRVTIPGRPAYDVQHRQLVSMFSIAALQIGATVAVMVDPTDPNRLTIDVTGEGIVAPNTISTDLPGQEAQLGAPVAGASLAGPAAVDAATAAAITDTLSRLGITVDPSLIAGGQMTMDAATLDLRPDAMASVLADGVPGTAFIRTMTDTGVNVRGESLVRLALDVKGPDGGTYRVETGGLVPDAARSRALPGATVPVRIDQAQPANVVIDWAALK